MKFNNTNNYKRLALRMMIEGAVSQLDREDEQIIRLLLERLESGGAINVSEIARTYYDGKFSTTYEKIGRAMANLGAQIHKERDWMQEFGFNSDRKSSGHNPLSLLISIS